MFEQHWHHARIHTKGAETIKVSHREILMGGDSGEEHVAREEIVLESLDGLQLKNDGTEHDYPALRRRK